MSEGATFRERCDLLRDCGFDGVDAVTPSELDVDALHSAAEAAGIEVANVLAGRSLRWVLADPDPEVRAYGREGLERSLCDAVVLGAGSVMLPSLLPPAVSPTAERKTTAEELRRVLPLAGKLGIRIAIDNCWNGFLDSAKALAEFVDCNWGAVAAAFRRIGFDGWMSAELTGSGRELLIRTSVAMDRLFA